MQIFFFNDRFSKKKKTMAQIMMVKK